MKMPTITRGPARSNLIAALGATVIGAQTYVTATAPEGHVPTIISEAVGIERVVDGTCWVEPLPVVCTTKDTPLPYGPILDDAGKVTPVGVGLYVASSGANQMPTSPLGTMGLGLAFLFKAKWRRKDEEEYPHVYGRKDR